MTAVCTIALKAPFSPALTVLSPCVAYSTAPLCGNMAQRAGSCASNTGDASRRRLLDLPHRGTARVHTQSALPASKIRSTKEHLEAC